MILFVLLVVILLSGCTKYKTGITCKDANLGAVLFGGGDVEEGYKLLCTEVCAKHNVKPFGSYSCDQETGEVLCSCQSGGLSDEDLIKQRECGNEFQVQAQPSNDLGTVGFGKNYIDSNLFDDNGDLFHKYVKNSYVNIEKDDQKKLLDITLNFDNNKSIKEACIHMTIMSANPRNEEYCQNMEEDSTPPGVVIEVVSDGETIPKHILTNMYITTKFKIIPQCD